jgi:hypothetical protein
LLDGTRLSNVMTSWQEPKSESQGHGFRAEQRLFNPLG